MRGIELFCSGNDSQNYHNPRRPFGESDPGINPVLLHWKCKTLGRHKVTLWHSKKMTPPVAKNGCTHCTLSTIPQNWLSSTDDNIQTLGQSQHILTFHLPTIYSGQFANDVHDPNSRMHCMCCWICIVDCQRLKNKHSSGLYLYVDSTIVGHNFR